MIKIIIVGIGGFLGAISRYLTSRFVNRYFETTQFPFGTLSVNMIGCFLIGFVMGLVENRDMFNPEVRSFILIGLLGGFTTFSTFGYESYNLLRDGQILSTISNICIHVFIGLTLVWFGNFISRLL